MKDVVKANILAMGKNADGVFNIASGKSIRIKELAREVMEITGNELKVVYDEPRRGDVRHSLGGIRKAKDKLGYEPGYSLERGLEETIEFFRRCNEDEDSC